MVRLVCLPFPKNGMVGGYRLCRRAERSEARRRHIGIRQILRMAKPSAFKLPPPAYASATVATISADWPLIVTLKRTSLNAAGIGFILYFFTLLPISFPSCCLFG